MRDYAELIFDLRRHYCDAKENDTQEVCEECAYDVIVADKSKFSGITDVCTCGLMHRAADAIEELVAAVRSVVHCKDCKWCHAGYCEKYDDLIPWGCANKPWEDWFCADGKRREIIKEEQDAD